VPQYGRAWLNRPRHIGIVASVLALMALPFLISYCSVSHAHAWFDLWCCSGQDCQPAPVGSVKWTPGGWRVHTAAFSDVVPFDDVRIKYVPHEEPNQQIYLCEYPAHTLRCLYIPETGG
jgi:hypothetical protein